MQILKQSLIFLAFLLLIKSSNQSTIQAGWVASGSDNRNHACVTQPTDTSRTIKLCETPLFDSINKFYPGEIAIPSTNNASVILKRKGFTIGYDTMNYQAQWVAYMLTTDQLNGKAKRSNRFFPASDLGYYSAVDADYIKTGYDRGHLAPAADMAWSEETMRESFCLANISPQKPSFNRGIWKKLEERVRGWAKTYDTIWIVTGPIIENSDTFCLRKKIAIPGKFYKALLLHKDHKWQSIAFLLPNEGSNLPLNQFAITIRHLEEISLIDFFSILPDSIENQIELRCPVDEWLLN